MRHRFRGVRVVLHDRTDWDDDGLGSLDTRTSEVWRMEVVEPSSHFVRRGICEKEADLALYTLAIMVDARANRD